MKSKHILQLESLIKRVLSECVQNDLQKNVGLLTITDTNLTSDYSYCTVYYTVLDAKDKKRAYEGLNASKKYLRGVVASRVSMKRIPELIFKYDDSYERGARIEEILRELKEKENNK